PVEGTSDRHPLPLSAGEVAAALEHSGEPRLVAVRELLQERCRTGAPCGVAYLCGIGGLYVPPDGHILLGGEGVPHEVLKYHRHARAQGTASVGTGNGADPGHS